MNCPQCDRPHRGRMLRCDACGHEPEGLLIPTRVEGAPEESEAPDAFLRGTTLGRYVILEAIGAGGMGVVYSAFDPELGRKVAIKIVHHSQPSTRVAAGLQRLTREAQAMAQLSHPNVVTVLDVGHYADRLFLAMEFVEGQTLHQWLRKEPRDWRAVLNRFQEAGKGLAAAHAAGLVHRDFKPDNVLLGDDGRIRVTDFGLARAVEAQGVPAPEAGESARGAAPRHPGEASEKTLLTTTLTQFGAVIGTVAYMSPEQLRGKWVDERSDQFSFCVALYQALYRELPYEIRETPLATAESIEAGPVKPPASGCRAPAWLRQILLRGLSGKPEDRYPSMAELLAALARDPSVRRRRMLALAAVLLVVAGGTLLAVRSRFERARLCQEGESRIRSVWSEGTKDGIEQAFLSTRLPFARAASAGVGRAFDGYSDAWAEMYHDACEATRIRRVQTEEVLDWRMGCLEARRIELRTLVRVFGSADARTVEEAVAAAQKLSEIESCSAVAALGSRTSPGADGADDESGQRLRESLAEVRALRVSGEYREALTRLGELAPGAAASASHSLPLKAELLLERTSLELIAGEIAASEQSLDQGLWAAEASGHDEITARLWLQMIRLRGEGQARPAEAHRAAGHADAVLTRIGENGRLRAALYLDRGTVFLEEHRLEDALEDFGRSREILERVAPEDLVFAKVLRNTGIVFAELGRYQESLDEFDRALEVVEESVGQAHPSFADVLINVSVALERLGRGDEALVVARRALAIYENGMGQDHPWIAIAADRVGELLTEKGDYEAAAESFERALRIDTEVYGEKHPNLAYSLQGLGRVHRLQGRFDDALSRLGAALDLREASVGKSHPLVAEILVDIGLCELSRGVPGAAIPPLERALAITRTASQDRAELAELKFALARASIEAGRDPERALKLAREARADFIASGNPSSDEEARKVAAWIERARR